MADAQDLKSWDRKKSCEFESHHRHQPSLDPTRGAATRRPLYPTAAAKANRQQSIWNLLVITSTREYLRVVPV
jgi:hypothetical protein